MARSGLRCNNSPFNSRKERHGTSPSYAKVHTEGRAGETAAKGALGLRGPPSPAHLAPDSVPASTPTCRPGETIQENLREGQAQRARPGHFKNLEVDESRFRHFPAPSLAACVVRCVSRRC